MKKKESYKVQKVWNTCAHLYHQTGLYFVFFFGKYTHKSTSKIINIELATPSPFNVSISIEHQGVKMLQFYLISALCTMP